MMFKQRALQALALCAIAGLVACGGGGGGSHGFVPVNPGSPGGGQPQIANNAMMKVTLPSSTTTGQKRGQYITTQGTSSLVVSVQPSDPAEAAVWATTYGVSGFTVCYNIFNNGAPVTTNPAVTVAVGPPVQVTFPFPAPPGQDTFTVSQYAGACASAYAPPTPAPSPVPTLSPAQLIISQSQPLVVNFQPGVTNSFNTALFACGVYPAATGTCTVPGGVGTITPSLSGSVSFVYMAGSNATLPLTLAGPIPLPIAAPMREHATFTSVPANRVGMPIPVVGLDGTGHSIPFTVGPPVTSGLLPNGPNNTACTSIVGKVCNDKITLTLSETDVSGSNHFQLELVDAATGAIAQNPGTTVNLTQLNALNCPTDCPNGGTNNDKYVVVMTFDGTSAAASTSATVTLSGTLAGASITPQVLTVKPQASLFTAVAAGPANGYTDAAAPYTSAADILNTTGAARVAAAGQGYWVSDAGNMHLVGTGTFAVAGAATLTGMTLDNNTNLTAGQILAVDTGNAANSGSATPVKGGFFVFDPVAHTSNPIAIQDLTTGNYVGIGTPSGIAFVQNGYVYVFAGTKVYVVDPQSNGAGGLAQITSGVTYDIAEEIGTLTITGFGGYTGGYDVVVSGTKLTFPDVTNNKILQIDTASCVPGGAACTPTVIASGHAFIGLAANGSGYVATDNKGQIYTITSGGTVTSLGLSSGASAKDGVVGVIGTTPLVPIPYTPQGQATNFFGASFNPTTPTAYAPYNIAPFNATGPVFTVAPAAFAADTSNATFGTTAGNTVAGFGIAAIGAGPFTTTALTPNSYLFADNGALRTLVP